MVSRFRLGKAEMRHHRVLQRHRTSGGSVGPGFKAGSGLQATGASGSFSLSKKLQIY
jgi:hypothetical protein